MCQTQDFPRKEKEKERVIIVMFDFLSLIQMFLMFRQALYI